MKEPNLNRWTDPKATEGLLLVAQRMQEALFDYTFSSYKAPALTTNTRSMELSQAIDDVRQKRLPEKSIHVVCDELAWSIENDVAARALLGNMTAVFVNAKWWSEGSLDSLETKVDLLRSFLRGRSYERQLILEIKQRLGDAKRKHELTTLAVDLAVTWVDHGFTRHFVFQKIKSFFFRGAGSQVDSNERFDDFVKTFNRDQRTYEVLLKVSRKHKRVLEVLGKVATFLEAAPAAKSRLFGEARFLRLDTDVAFLHFKDVQAHDARDAANNAQNSLEAVNRIVLYHAHQGDVQADATSLVYDGKLPILLKPAPLAVHKARERDEESLPTAFSETAVSIIRKLDQDSRDPMTAALGMHTSAVASKDPPVQLSSLWSAIETLLLTTEDQANISEVIESLVPALCRYYPLRLLRQLHNDFERCAPTVLSEVLNQVLPESAPHLRFMSIVAIDSLEPQRDTLYAALPDNPLLRFRLFELKRDLSSAKAIRTLVDRHRTKVDWHIRASPE